MGLVNNGGDAEKDDGGTAFVPFAADLKDILCVREEIDTWRQCSVIDILNTDYKIVSVQLGRSLMQTIILAVTLVLMAVVALVFWKVVGAVNASGEAANTGSRRRIFFWALLVFGILVTVGSLRQWPHAIASGDGVVQVNATGAQWSWEIDTRKVPVGKQVVFNLHTKDVNHGFGVVDQSGRLLFQMQAMPGYVNQVTYVFEQLGQYRVLCMEFCGVGHHDMNDTFEVVAN